MRDHRFQAHTSSTAIIDEFCKDGELIDREDRLRRIRKNGMWAFVVVPDSMGPSWDDPCVIHFWHRKDSDPVVVAQMLAHELGHIADGGPRYPAGTPAEEERADEYARAASETVQLILALGLVTRNGSKRRRTS